MALSAIICATHPCSDHQSMSRCTIEAFGMMLGERVMRQLAAAGISKIFILADKASSVEIPALPLHIQGVTITPVSRALDLAVQLEDRDDILLIEEGALVDQRLIDMVAQHQERHIVLCWSTEASDKRGSRLIDATHGFASVLKTTGYVVRTVVKGLGEWDFEQTLLRAVVSHDDALSLSAEAARGEAEKPLLWQTVHTGADAQTLRDILIANEVHNYQDRFFSRLVAPLVRKALELIPRTRMTGIQLHMIGLLHAAIAVLVLSFGFLWGGWALMASMPVWPRLGDLVGRLRLEVRHRLLRPDILHDVQRLLGYGWWAALGFTLGATHGYVTMLTLASTTILLLIVQRGIVRLQRLTSPAPVEDDYHLLAASSYRLLWLLLPFACFDRWSTGMIICALYTATSFSVLFYRFQHMLTTLFMQRSDRQTGYE